MPVPTAMKLGMMERTSPRMEKKPSCRPQRAHGAIQSVTPAKKSALDTGSRAALDRIPAWRPS
jgi:hypothetical protein